MIILETKRLLFRTHIKEDRESFVAMHTDSEVRRYVGGQAWSQEKAIQRFRDQYLGNPTEMYGLWATVLKSENKYIGCCGLRAAGQKAAHLAYYLARPYWRQGLATEASVAFINFAFDRLGLQRLLADVTQGNAVSEHILAKFGFTYLSQEVIAANGRVILTYELAQTTWKAARTQAE